MPVGKDTVDAALGLMLLLIVGAAVLPQALSDWFNASTADWGTGAAAIWPIVPLLGLVGIALLVYRKYG